MEKIKIMGGESRSKPGCACDYVLFWTDDGTEVYIEGLIPADATEQEADYDSDRWDALYIQAAERIPGYVINQWGNVLDYDAAVELMDDDIREAVHAALEDDVSPQEFFGLYCAAHIAATGKGFFLNDENPVW